MADLGAPYSILLYERFLGRRFAAHRDSVSELVGSLVESAIEDVLARAGISFRKTGRAERLPGFDQAPDFVVPNEFNPQIVIEAKLTGSAPISICGNTTPSFNGSSPCRGHAYIRLAACGSRHGHTRRPSSYAASRNCVVNACVTSSSRASAW